MAARILQFFRWISTLWTTTTARTEGTAALDLAVEVEDPTVELPESVSEAASVIADDPGVVIPDDLDQSVVHIVQPHRGRVRRAHQSATPTRSPRWEFKRDILERLDEYFFCIRRMRKHDPDSYALLSQTGLTIPTSYCLDELASTRIRTPLRPAFGGILFGLESRPGWVYPSFFYFQKMDHPSRVQWAQGEVYALTLLYDNRKEHREKLVAPCSCYVAVAHTGEVNLLRQATPVTSTVYRKTGRRKERLELTQVQWQYPNWLHSIREDHPDTLGSVEEFAAEIMAMAVDTYTESHAKTTIRVHHETDVAAFGIELSRCPRFFADRDATALAVDGKRKRIFHSVVQHARRLPDKSVEVKAHYRGLRAFDWNGYHVGIVWPTTDLRTFTAASTYLDDIAPEERGQFWSSRKTGTKLAELLDR